MCLYECVCVYRIFVSLRADLCMHCEFVACTSALLLFAIACKRANIIPNKINVATETNVTGPGRECATVRGKCFALLRGQKGVFIIILIDCNVFYFIFTSDSRFSFVYHLGASDLKKYHFFRICSTVKLNNKPLGYIWKYTYTQTSHFICTARAPPRDGWLGIITQLMGAMGETFKGGLDWPTTTLTTTTTMLTSTTGRPLGRI